MAWIFMLNADTGAVNWVEVGLTYGVLAAVILVSLIALAIVKKRAKKEATLSNLKTKCAKATAYLDKLSQRISKRDLLIASTKLLKLNSLVVEAEWCATCIVEDKKDMIMEGLAARLDALGTVLAKKAEEAFIAEDEYRETLAQAKTELASIAAQVELLMPQKEGK